MQHVSVIKGHDGDISRLLFSHDDQIIISAGEDQTIKLWDTQTLQQIGLPITNGTARQLFVDFPHIDTLLGYSGHEEKVVDIALSPDDTKLVSMAFDEEVRIWELDIKIWLERACERAGRNLTEEEWDLYLPDEPYRKTCPQFP